MVEVCASYRRAPTLSQGQVSEKFALEIDAKGLPRQADGAACKRDIVARLDPIQILKEEAATGKTVLMVILGFEQEQRGLRQLLIGGRLMLLAVACPEALWRLPAIAQRQVLIARRPG